MSKKLYYAIILLFLLQFVGCGEEDPLASESVMIRYEGELWWDKNGLQWVGGDGVDTVVLIVTGADYSYALKTNSGNFSWVDGTVAQFGNGLDSAVFSPTFYSCLMCDTIGTLSGTFAVRFSGDSLYMTGHRFHGGHDWDWDYRLVVVAQ